MISRADRPGPFASAAGFTLLEVMIAMTILALALTILLSSISSGVIYSGNSRDVITASFLAQEKMTELERKREMLAANSDESGQFEDEFQKFSWRYTVVADTSVEDMTASLGVEFPFEPLKVEITVSWKQGNNERSYVLQEMMFPAVVTSTSTSTQPAPTEFNR